MFRYGILWLILLAFGVSSFLFGQTPSTASTPDYSSQAFVIEQLINKLTFENDGSGSREASLRVRVQSGAGVQKWGLLSLPYASSSETLTLDHIWVRKPDGAVIETPSENIQDMPSQVTREAPFYSDLREKQVAVKGLSPGDTVDYLAHWQVTKPLTPGQFWTAYAFTTDSIVLEERLEISVPRDRAVKFRSSDPQPVVTEEGLRRIYTWTRKNTDVKNKGDQDDKEEETKTQMARGRFPAPEVLLSSFKNWEEVGRTYSDLQRERVQPTPEIKAKAAELVKDAKDEDAKIRAIYNYVSLQVRYIGIAFGIGRIQAHAATEVMANQYGDCKDKHTLLASLLQAVGIPAYPALTNISHVTDQEVPSVSQFDHVITAVPRGKDFLWLDTTAEVAPLGFLFAPLRDKPALVIPPDKPATFVTTPADPPFPLLATFHLQGKLSDDGTLDGKAERSDRSDTEVLMRAAFRRTARSQWNDLAQGISYASGFGGAVTETDASMPELTDSPFHLSYSYNKKNFGGDWEHHRITMPLPIILLPTFKDDAKKPTEPIWLGSPQKADLESTIELPKGYQPQLPSTQDIVEDFAEYHASYTIQNGALKAERHLISKMREVPISEYVAYTKFTKIVQSDRDLYIGLMKSESITPTTYQDAIWKLPFSNDPEASDLYDQAVDKSEKNDWDGTIVLLKRSLESDPKLTRAWLWLGQIYKYRHHPDLALEAYRTALRRDPQPLTYKVLAFNLDDQGKHEEAVSVWRQLVTITPEDADAFSYMADSLFKLKQYDETVTALESAIRLAPDRVPFYLLAGSYELQMQHADKALTAFKKALELDASANTYNDIGYELANANQELNLAQQYGEKAVNQIEELAGKISLADLKQSDLGTINNLAAYWDTLGWVYFRANDLDRAQKYLNAAWVLSQYSAVGDHLAELYERRGDKKAAIRMAAMVVAGNDRWGKARERLTRLTGSKQKADQAVNEGRSDLSLMRSTHLPRVFSGIASAEFFLLFSPGPKVDDVKFISGSENLKDAGKVLRSAKFDVPFPTDAATHILRRGLLACSALTGCEIVLYPSSAVRSVN